MEIEGWSEVGEVENGLGFKKGEEQGFRENGRWVSKVAEVRGAWNAATEACCEHTAITIMQTIPPHAAAALLDIAPACATPVCKPCDDEKGDEVPW